MCRTCAVPEKRRGGFSLVELVLVLGMLLLAAALALPDLHSLTRGRETEKAAREMLMALRIARWRAAASGYRTRISTGGAEGGRQPGYVMEREVRGRWVADGKRRRLPEGVDLWTTGPSAKVFNPNGTCSLGSIVLSGDGGRRYRLSLNPATGRVRLWRGEKELSP